MGANANDFRYRNKQPVLIMACTLVYGPSENIASAYLTFAGWLSDNAQYTPSLDRVENPGVPQWCDNWPKSIDESGDFD